MEKICPLRMVAEPVHNDRLFCSRVDTYHLYNCIENECAWYNDALGCCVVHTLITLGGLNAVQDKNQ